MTDDELKDWFLKQVGTVQHGREEVIEVSEPDILDLIRRAREDEREECAKVSLHAQKFHEMFCTDKCKCNDGNHIAAAIRNRKDTK